MTKTLSASRFTESWLLSTRSVWVSIGLGRIFHWLSHFLWWHWISHCHWHTESWHLIIVTNLEFICIDTDTIIPNHLIVAFLWKMFRIVNVYTIDVFLLRNHSLVKVYWTLWWFALLLQLSLLYWLKNWTWGFFSKYIFVAFFSLIPFDLAGLILSS